MDVPELPTNERYIMRIVLASYWMIIIATFMVLAILLDQGEATGLIIFICGMVSFIILLGIKLTWKSTGRSAHLPQSDEETGQAEISITSQSEVLMVNQNEAARGRQGQNIVNLTIRQEVILSPRHLSNPDVDPPDYQSVCQKQTFTAEEELPPTYYEALSLSQTDKV